MPKTVRVTIAEREYEIEELRSRANAEWRQRLREPFGALTARLESAGQTDVTKLGDVAQLVKETAGTLMNAPDLLAELLFAYSPVLAADQERILAESYDSELMSAFIEVLKLAYPFGSVVTKLGGLKNLGSQPKPTTVN